MCCDATFVHRRLGFKRSDVTFVHRRLGFKRFLCVAMLLLCTGAWDLRDSKPLLCTGAWVLRSFCGCDATFVHRRVGFKRF